MTPLWAGWPITMACGLAEVVELEWMQVNFAEALISVDALQARQVGRSSVTR